MVMPKKSEVLVVGDNIPATTGRAAGIVAQPQELLEEARLAARCLKDVLDQKPDKVMMNGQQYLEYEDWQTLGQFYGYTVQTRDAVEVNIAGVRGAKAEADLLEFRTGVVVGHAEAYCMRDEDKWNTRAKYEWRDMESGRREKVHIGDEPVPWFQLASMAQTRAGAKAFRNRLAWVVVLAGYKATPAEELDGTERVANGKPSGAPSAEHWCKKHSTAFFKRGKMTGFAHPVKDETGNETGEWCREETASKEATPKEATPKAAAPKAKKEKPTLTGEELLNLKFANPGEFYQAGLDYLHMNKSMIDKEISMYDISNPGQRAQAWKAILAVSPPQDAAAPETTPKEE
jgi:hypothetical protein